MLVTTWANPFVFRHLFCQWRAINSLVEVAKLGGLRLPDLAMAGCLPSQCMGDLVQNHLLDNVHVTGFNQVP